MTVGLLLPETPTKFSLIVIEHLCPLRKSPVETGI